MKRYTKIRQEQRAEQKKREREAQDEKRLKRALKAVKLGLMASDSQRINALEKYHGELLALRADLVGKYGELREFVNIDIEISHTVEQIAKLRVSQIKPELL